MGVEVVLPLGSGAHCLAGTLLGVDRCAIGYFGRDCGVTVAVASARMQLQEAVLQRVSNVTLPATGASALATGMVQVRCGQAASTFPCCHVSMHLL